MAEITVGRPKENTISLRLKVADGKNRQTTDKHWSLLFVVFFFILLAVGPDVIRYKPVCQTGLDNTKTINNTSSVFFNHTHNCKVTSNDSITVRKTIEHALHIWGNNWLFDAITCNVGFIDAHYEKSGALVIWANLLACVCLIAYAVSSMRSDYSHRNQMIFFGMIFVSCTFHTRINSDIRRKEDITSLPTLIIPLSLPETILIIVGWAKSKIPKKCYKPTVADEGKRDVYVLIFSFYLMLLALACFTLSELHVFRAIRNCEFDWDKGWSYVVAGIVCYMCLMFYYYVLMVISCATSLSYNDSPILHDDAFKNFFRAWYIVARYHFGTLCYHATIILPRIEATFVMNKKEFKEDTKFSAMHRFYLTHWKVHDLTLTATAATGSNHSKSTRELLRLLTSDLPERKNFQSYSQVFRVLSTLLLAINNLIFISAWMHGATFHPRSFMAVWVTDLLGIFIAYLVIKFFDAIADAVWLNYDGKVRILV